MMQLTIGFITTCSGRWPREIPEQRNKEYGDWLEAQMPESKVVRAPELGSGSESVEAAVKEFKRQEVDVIVLVYGAFTGDDVASYLAEMLQKPIILWAPYEVPFEREDRLYSNALCSMTMNAAALRRLGVSCHTVYGSREEDLSLIHISEPTRPY